MIAAATTACESAAVAGDLGAPSDAAACADDSSDASEPYSCGTSEPVNPQAEITKAGMAERIRVTLRRIGDLVIIYGMVGFNGTVLRANALIGWDCLKIHHRACHCYSLRSRLPQL